MIKEGMRINQNFSFMKQFKDKILDGTKTITNRTATEFRGKINAGDIMHCFTGMRTSSCEKWCDSLVIERAKWEYEDVPVPVYTSIAKNTRSPFIQFTWYDFAMLDGFMRWYDFVDYFLSHKNRELGFYAYKFEVIK